MCIPVFGVHVCTCVYKECPLSESTIGHTRVCVCVCVWRAVPETMKDNA